MYMGLRNADPAGETSFGKLAVAYAIPDVSKQLHLRVLEGQIDVSCISV